MGRGATATMEGLATSVGLLSEVSPGFAAALDIPRGGALLALPAPRPAARCQQIFSTPKGFYGLKTIFLLLAFMALARLKSIEALRYPGTDLRLIYELVSAQTP
jgi:Transposase protein